MTAWDWQWQMAWDPWEESQRPDWKIRAWRMQRDRARRTKEFEERRLRVALQESAALRRLREVRQERLPRQVQRSSAAAAAAVGTGAVGSGRAQRRDSSVVDMRNRFAGPDLEHTYRHVEGGVESTVDGKRYTYEELDRWVTSIDDRWRGWHDSRLPAGMTVSVGFVTGAPMFRGWSDSVIPSLKMEEAPPDGTE